MRTQTNNRLFAGWFIVCLAVGVMALAWCRPMPADTFDWTRPDAVQEEFPKTLDKALTLAMERNPDIGTAKARVKLAEAELNATQMEATRKIIAKWTELQIRRRTLANLQSLNAQTKGVPLSEIIEVGAAVDRVEADLRYLIGQSSPAAPRSDSVGVAVPGKKVAAIQLPHGPMVEKVRKALLSPSTVDFNEAPLADIMDYLKEVHKIEIQIDGPALKQEGYKDPAAFPITINLKSHSLIAAFQAIEDRYPSLKFVVRDYGILVTTPKVAETRGYFPASELAKGAPAASDTSEPVPAATPVKAKR